MLYEFILKIATVTCNLIVRYVDILPPPSPYPNPPHLRRENDMMITRVTEPSRHALRSNYICNHITFVTILTDVNFQIFVCLHSHCYKMHKFVLFPKPTRTIDRLYRHILRQSKLLTPYTMSYASFPLITKANSPRLQ